MLLRAFMRGTVMKLMGMKDTDINVGGLKYTSIGFDKLGASAYTLVGIAVDETGSVQSFKQGLEDMLFASLESCQKSPNVLNLLVRSTAFNYSSGSNIRELHGFELLNALDLNVLKGSIDPRGNTNLFDATAEMLDAMHDYGKQLRDKFYQFNGVFYVITDGDDNSSKTTLSTLKEKIAKIKREELFEELHIILIGINDTETDIKEFLDKFEKEACLDAYISMGKVTPQKLAKLGGFVSQSISSHSQAIQNGAPSQPIFLKF